MFKTLTILLAWLALGAVVLPGPAHAQPAAATPATVTNTTHTLRLASDAKGAPATIKEVAWLQGRWMGEGLGGPVEEIWAAPAHGQMMGMFRYEREGKLVFYEFLTLAEQDGSLVLRVKHFNPDMTGWEEKDKFVTFRFIKAEGDRIYFSGFTFERQGHEGWVGYLAMRSKDGSVADVKFTFRRVPL